MLHALTNRNRLRRIEARLLLSALLALVILPGSLPARAQDSSRQDHIINGYFANDAVRVDGWLQPVRVIHSIQGNHPAAAALFVLNLSLSRGIHRIEAVVLGPDGSTFRTIPFTPETVESDREPRAIWSVLRGRFPTGGITLEVIHSRDNATPESLGRFYLHTLP